MRRFVPVFLFLLTGLSSLQCQGPDLRNLSRQLADAIDKSGKQSVAVVDFTDLQGRVTEFGRYLSEELSISLATSSSKYKVIDRTNLMTILQEHKLAATGIIDPHTARKLGEITGVQTLVTGTITPLGGSVRLAVKLLDAQTAQVITGVTTDLTRTSAIDEMIRKGVAENVQASQSGQEPEKTGKPAPKVVASSRIGDCAISIESCQEAGDKTECWGTITWSGMRSAPIEIYQKESYFIDNLGNQSKRTFWYGSDMLAINVGSGGPAATLEPNMPGEAPHTEFWPLLTSNLRVLDPLFQG